MPRVIAYEGRAVMGANGRRLGYVGAVLFHLSEPRVVGVQIDRAAILGVIDRRPHFALLADLESAGAEGFVLPMSILPKEEPGERTLGFSWHDSVIWHRMPVRSASGDAVGTVHDVVFEAEGGAVTKLVVSTGAVGDAALGRLEVPGELVQGFDGDAVIVLPGYNEIRAAGGAAKAMASGVAAVKVRGEAVADGALQVGVAAAGALGRSLKRGTARKALDKMKSLMGEDE